jgi:hypothetical protein
MEVVMKWVIGFLLVGWAGTAGLWKEDHRSLKAEIELEKARGESRFDFIVAYYRANYTSNERCQLQMESLRRLCE